MELSQLISVNFNLRKPKSTTPTPLYMVVYYVSEGVTKQAKIPTGKKVLPMLWDSKRQQPILTSVYIDLTDKQLREQAELTAFVSNCRILALSQNFSTFDELKQNINLTTDNDMTVTPQFIQSKKTPKATKAMEAVLKLIDSSNKSKSTKYAYRKNYNKWCEWLVSTKQVDSMKVLSQLKFNEFKKWLLNQGATNAMVNDTCGYIARIIKELVSGEGGNYGVAKVTYKNLESVKKNKCEILEGEIQALKDTKTISEREEFYKNVFLLQLSTGQRISDTYTLIKGEYTTQSDGNGNEFIIIETKKGKKGTNVKKSYIPVNEEVKTLLQVLQGSELIPATDKTLTGEINTEIKEIARRAGLNRITPNGKPLHEAISSHYARHTQATRLARNGMTSEQIALQLGNSSEMVERVYTHPTDTDIINKLTPIQPTNTPAPQVAAQTHVQAEQPAPTQQARTKIEATKNIGDYDVTLQANGGNDFDNYLIKKELNNKLARLKELRESNVMSEGVFDYSLHYVAMRNEYRKLYNELIKKVLVKLKYPTQAIESKSSEELQNTLYLMRGDLDTYISKGQIKVLFAKSQGKDKEVDDLLNKIGVLTDILEA
jgi:site-specific recombinase, phage integrase family